MTVPPCSIASEPGSGDEAELFKKLACAFGFLAIVTSVVSIFGNISGIVLLSSVCEGCKTMSLSASLAWIFFGAVLIFLSLRSIGRTGSLLLRALLVVIAGAAAMEILSGIGGGHFFTEPWFIAAGSILFGLLSSPITPVSAGFIILAAFGLFFFSDSAFLSTGRSRTPKIMVAAGIVITLISFTLVLSYFYGNPFFYGTPVIPIAALAAIAAGCIGAGLIAAAGPATPPFSYFIGTSIRAILLRNFVSLTVAVTFSENIFFTSLGPGIIFRMRSPSR